MGNKKQKNNDWIKIQPEVEKTHEFNEIVNDFGNPLEILREAISNAIDWGAKSIKIHFNVDEIKGNKRLVIEIEDDGLGMTKEVLCKDFWGLGYSKSRGDQTKIGEKGHGTKIYLRSEKVQVKTQSSEGAYEAICEMPLALLHDGSMHEPKIREIENFRNKNGTWIQIIGYNDNERSKFIQTIVKDYILWFTKIGSIDIQMGNKSLKDFKVYLKCIDKDEFEEIPFGHRFPEENSDINALFEKKGVEAADLFVKKYIKLNQRLDNHPEVTFDVIIYVEGDEVKRQYNPLIKGKGDSKKGTYRVADRYGIWICKDGIPIKQANNWITGFGSGSNSFVLLHGFVNCQSLKLTANRGDISNTDPQILDELEESVKGFIDDVDTDLKKNGLFILREWQDELRTMKQEESEFNRRKKSFEKRKVAIFDDHLIIEPTNESELFGLFMTVYSLKPDIFEFEPIDYNTIRGVDIIARNRNPNKILEGDFSYIELKYHLSKNFNHAFKYLRWIICWDFDKTVNEETSFIGLEENDIRFLKKSVDREGKAIYFLDNNQTPHKIQVIPLKELLECNLALNFENQK